MKRRPNGWTYEVARCWTVGVCALAMCVGSGSAEQIAPGVNYTVYNTTGPNVVYVVAIDRSRSEYKLETGWPQKKRNFTAKSRVSQTAALYDLPPAHDVLAATNGAYYDPVNLPAVIGTATGAGDIAEPPDVHDDATDTLFFGPSRVPAIRSDLGHVAGVLTFANGSTIALDKYNIYPPPINKITAYTPTWDSSTRSTFVNPSLAAEVILTNVTYPMRGDKEISGIVSAIRTGAASQNNAIPAGGMVLTCYAGPMNTVLANTSVGDRLRMRFLTSVEEYNNAEFSITGIGWIIHNGIKQTANWSVRPSGTPYSRDPMTVLGWNNNYLYMVVCDGRSGVSVGMTFDEMANFLINTLGALGAINLDGGGSSTMWVNGSVRNVPSDGSERAVTNAVMLVKQDTSTQFPLADVFGAAGRLTGWDDKFFYAGVLPFTPASPGGDGYVLRVLPTTGKVDTVRRGDWGDTDYSVESDIYCDYRPDVAADGYERCGIFARDSGTGAFALSNYGGGNCYALVYDSNNGRIQAGKFVNGTLTDLLGSPMYAPTTAWRRFRIDCTGAAIRYSVDGTPILSVNDTTFAHGYFGVGYQHTFLTASNARGTRADNFNAFVDTSGMPPIANFTGTPLSGSRPLNVQFTDSSAGTGINQWSWNFGDQATSNAQNPSHVYDTPGQYTVTLTVTNPWGSDTKVRANYVQVLPSAGDLDGDGDVDLDDVAILQVCLSGSGIPQNNPACAGAKLEGGDSDVDSGDMTKIRGCLSGAGIPSNPNCAN